MNNYTIKLGIWNINVILDAMNDIVWVLVNDINEPDLVDVLNHFMDDDTWEVVMTESWKMSDKIEEELFYKIEEYLNNN